MRRIGVLGTMVWDRIHSRDGREQTVEEWGGICYALAALVAARPEDWELVPIIKIGDDLAEPAYRFLRALPGLDLEAGLRTVPEPNNRVELRYTDRDRRCERITGGVPPWTWPELAPILEGLDALYINFISGFEMDLETAVRVRLTVRRPIYADLHSLLLGVDATGRRVPRTLLDWREWLRCFDMAQVNEEELACLAGAWGDPWRFAADVVHTEPRLLLVTLGSRGAIYFAGPAFRPDPAGWYTDGLALDRPLAVTGPVRSERVPVEAGDREGDPTGCGDVWGATCFLRLMAGDALDGAIAAANRAAARNVEHRGATGLAPFLQGRLGP